MSTTEPSASKKLKKKKDKGKTLSLQTFLGDPTSGTNFAKDPSKPAVPSNSWADATEDIDPSDISTSWPDEQKHTFDRSVLPSGPRASSALQIDRSRLPSSPPYTVYLGNLPYDCNEDDIYKFFQRNKLVASSVRLPVESGTNKMRGFGYAEFDTVNDLMEALTLNAQTLKNRPLAVDIAGGKGGGDDIGGRGRWDAGDDRTSGDWRRGGQDDTDMGNSPTSYGYRGREQYGSSNRYERRSSSEYRSRGSSDYGRDDYDRDRGGYGHGGYDRGPQRSRGYGQGWDRDDQHYERRDQYRGGPDNRYRDRSRRGYDDRRHGFDGRGSPEYKREEPVERPRIKLQPRSKPVEEQTNGGTSSSSIFGGAKPVDTASREREIEKKLAKNQEVEEVVEKQQPDKAGSVFGGAKPVDTTAREREIEEKLARENELLEKKLAEKDVDGPIDGRDRSHDNRDGSRDRRDGSHDSDRVYRRHYSSEDSDRPTHSGDRGRGREREQYDDRQSSYRDVRYYDDLGKRRDSNERRRGSDGNRRDSKERRRGSEERDSEQMRDDDSTIQVNRSSQDRQDVGVAEEVAKEDDSRQHHRDHYGDQGGEREYRGDRNSRGNRRHYGDRNRDRGDRERGDRDRGDRERGVRDRGDRERNRDRGDRGDHGDRDRGSSRGFGKDRDRRNYRDDRLSQDSVRGGRGRGRGRGRPRDDKRDDLEVRPNRTDRGGEGDHKKAPVNAWSRGKPRSLGGVDARKVIKDPEPVTFSQPSRFASLQADDDSDTADQGQRSPSPAVEAD